MNERCDRLAVAQAELARTEPGYWVSAGNPKAEPSAPAGAPPAFSAIPGESFKLQEPLPAGTEEQGRPTPEQRTGDAETQGQQAMNILEALSVILDESLTFDQFRNRARTYLDSQEW